MDFREDKVGDKVFDFTWTIPDLQCGWVKREEFTSKFEASPYYLQMAIDWKFILEGGIPQEPKTYKPLQEHPNLFREFWTLTENLISLEMAGDPPTSEESFQLIREPILNFVNTYGFLGEASNIPTVPYHGSAESFWLWREESRIMNYTFRAWQMIQSKDEEGLRQEMTWWKYPKKSIPDIGGPFYSLLKREVGNKPKPEIPWRAALLNEPQGFIWRKTGKGDLLAIPARWAGGYKAFDNLDPIVEAETALEHIVNNHLSGRVSPQTRWGTSRYDKPQLYLYFVPNNLIGSMWLQFARCLDNNKEFRPCLICHKFIEISPDGSRADRTTCSNRCRQMLDRKRKRYEALTKRGLTKKKISQKMKIPLEDLKQILTRTRKVGRKRNSGSKKKDL